MDNFNFWTSLSPSEKTWA